MPELHTNRERIAAEIKRFIAANFLCDIDADEQLDDQANLFEAGILDSYGLLELVLHLESHFAVNLQESDLTSGKFASVGSMADVVLGRREL